MISPIRPYIHFAVTPLQFLEDERFVMPELMRPRRRVLRELSLDELLGFIPAPPLNAVAVKLITVGETEEKGTGKDLKQMEEQVAVFDDDIGKCHGIDKNSVKLDQSTEKSSAGLRKAVRSISPVPTSRLQSLPKAA